MSPTSEDRSALALAAQWASRITAVGMEMVVPGALGLWLDSKLGTRFVLGILGFLLGMVLGIWHLIRMTSQNPRRGTGRRNSTEGGTLDK